MKKPGIIINEIKEKLQEKQYFWIRGILRAISSNNFRSVWIGVIVAFIAGYLLYYQHYMWQLIVCAIATICTLVQFVTFKILCAYHDKHYVYYTEDGEVCVKYVKDSANPDPEKEKPKSKTFIPVVVGTNTKTNYFGGCKSLVEAKALHRTLAKQYHPDQTGDDGKKLSEINKQFAEFEKKMKSKTK